MSSALPRLSVRTAALAAVFGVFLAGWVQSADARPYYVAECLPDNPTASDAFWQRSESPSNFGLHYNCGSGTDGLAITYGGVSQEGDWASWGFNAPPGTTFSSITATYFINTENGVGGYWWPTPHAAQSFSTVGQGSYISWPNPNTTGIHFFMRCYRPTCERTTAPVLRVRHLFFTIDDPAPPTLEASGSLLANGVRHGTESLQLSSTDPAGGGVRSWKVIVNGQLAEDVDVCGEIGVPRYPGWVTSFRPCQASVGTTIGVNTSSPPFANGPNHVEVCAYDVAGNNSNCVVKNVMVDNSCPSSGGARATEADAGVESRSGLVPDVRIKSTRAPVVRGALRSASGMPVEGATVCVFERVQLADSSPELVAQTTTQSNGRFATQLDPGPSRELRIVYRYDNTVIERDARLRSTVVPTLRVPSDSLRNGQNAQFSGALPGPNAGGRAVTLQARVGRKWRTFKQLRTDADGRFAGIYRFTQTVGRAKYVFRALVKHQASYPYEPGSSRKRGVLVTG